jgi:hypothetical protein
MKPDNGLEAEAYYCQTDGKTPTPHYEFDFMERSHNKYLHQIFLGASQDKETSGKFREDKVDEAGSEGSTQPAAWPFRLQGLGRKDSALHGNGMNAKAVVQHGPMYKLRVPQHGRWAGYTERTGKMRNGYKTLAGKS